MYYIYDQSSVHTFEIQYLPEFTTLQISIIFVSNLEILMKLGNMNEQ